ncbi:MAG: thiamine phosphate synthase [Acidobacteriota bacterium]|nr:thiamine phosphate synthase [Acidobacteriota bacterium]
MAVNSVLCHVSDRRSMETAPGGDSAAALVALTAQAARAGVDWIEIREKDLGGRALVDLVSAVVGRAGAARILVNDRLDVALAAGAAGVHLAGTSVPVASARELCRKLAPGMMIGKSCHSMEEAFAAQHDGADYIFFGPIFQTPSKVAYGAPQGIERLREVCGAVAIPVIAIGGITPENAGACIAAGARGVAAIRWFQEKGDLEARVGALRAACG